ncbi:MAG: hypothetical protein K1X75_10620 [Leptospirales bacterium]|nr:hypothetical protein [Leptospirales bacterium]
MNRKALSIVFLSSLLAAALFPSCSPDSSSSPAAPEARISAHLRGTNQLAVTITVPPRYHAYLDAGDGNALIPVSFDWSASGLQPKPLSSPEGERDETVQARVLRGRSEFVFAADNAATASGRSVRVQTQICNEERGICYRPRWQDALIQAN